MYHSIDELKKKRWLNQKVKYNPHPNHMILSFVNKKRKEQKRYD